MSLHPSETHPLPLITTISLNDGQSYTRIKRSNRYPALHLQLQLLHLHPRLLPSSSTTSITTLEIHTRLLIARARRLLGEYKWDSTKRFYVLQAIELVEGELEDLGVLMGVLRGIGIGGGIAGKVGRGLKGQVEEKRGLVVRGLRRLRGLVDL